MSLKEIRAKEESLRELAEIFVEFEQRLGLWMTNNPTKNEKEKYGITLKVPKHLPMPLGRVLRNMWLSKIPRLTSRILKIAKIDDVQGFEDYVLRKISSIPLAMGHYEKLIEKSKKAFAEYEAEKEV